MTGTRALSGGDALAASSATLDGFLASVERQAFVMARVSTRDDEVALDIVQDTMLRMVERYADRPPDQLREVGSLLAGAGREPATRAVAGQGVVAPFRVLQTDDATLAHLATA